MDIPPPPDGFQIDSAPQTVTPQSVTLGTPHKKIDAGYDPTPGGGEKPIPGGPADPNRPGGELDPNNPKNERLTPEALDDTTSKLILTGQMDPMGMGGGPVRLQILNNRPVMLKKYGLTDQQLPSVQSQFKADSTAYAQRVNQLSFIQQATDAANQHIRQVSGYLKSLPAQTDLQPLNMVSNFAQRQDSKSTISQLDSTIPLLKAEFAKIMTANPSGAAQLTDDARQEFDILEGNRSPHAKLLALQALQQMGQGKINGVRTEIDRLHGRLTGGLETYAQMAHGAVPGASGPPPGSPPSDGSTPGSPTDPSVQNVGGFNDELTNNPHGAIEFHDALFNAAHAGQIKSVEDAQKWAAGFNKANGTDYGVADSPLTRKAIANAVAGKPFTVDLPQMSQTEAARMNDRIKAASDQAGASILGAADSATVGAFKPIIAAGDTLSDAASGKGFDYTGNLNADSQYIGATKDAHPGYYLGGQLAGGLVMPTFGARSVPELMKLGAGYGGLYGFNSSAGEPLAQKGVNALTDAVAGAALPMVLHGAGEAVGAVKKGVNALSSTLPEKPMDFAISPDALAQAGQQEGVTVNRAMVNPNLDSKITAVGKTMIGSRKMQSGMRDIGNQIQDQTQALGQGGTPMEPQAAGNVVGGISGRYIAQTGAQFQRLYGMLKTASNGIKLSAPQATSEVDKQISDLSQMPGHNSAQINYLQTLKNDFAKGLPSETDTGILDANGKPISRPQEPSGLSIQALRSFNSDIKRGIYSNGGLLFNPNDARLLAIAKAAKQDIVNGLQSAGKGALADRYQQIDAAYGERMDMIHSTLEKLVGKGDLSGEQVYGKLVSMAGPRGTAAGFGRMMAQASPSERNDIAATIADALGKNQAGDFSTAFLAKRINAMPQAMRSAVFGPDGAKSLSNLALLSKAHARVAGKLGGSPTGLANDYRGWLTDLLLGSGAGLFTHSEAKGLAIAGAAAGVKATRDIMNAKMLLNPDIQKWLSSTPATVNQRAIDVHFNRLNSIAARNPGIAQDVMHLKQAIMSAANTNSPIPASAAASQDQQQQPQ